MNAQKDFLISIESVNIEADLIFKNLNKKLNYAEIGAVCYTVLFELLCEEKNMNRLNIDYILFYLDNNNKILKKHIQKYYNKKVLK